MQLSFETQQGLAIEYSNYFPSLEFPGFASVSEIFYVTHELSRNEVNTCLIKAVQYAYWQHSEGWLGSRS